MFSESMLSNKRHSCAIASSYIDRWIVSGDMRFSHDSWRREFWNDLLTY